MRIERCRSTHGRWRHLLVSAALGTIAALSLLVVACQEPPATPVPPVTASATAPLPAGTPTPGATPDSPEPAAEPGEQEPAPAGTEDPAPLLDDFELETLPSGQDDFAPIGFVTWSDGSAVAVTPLVIETGDELALPDQEGSNTILQLDTEVGPSGWAGFTHAFADETLTAWTPRDWSAYEGISLWLYGRESGGTLYVDLLDNRNPDSRGDDAERWTYEIDDDFAGWRYLEIPFADFRRKEIGNGAPNDGLNLTALHGYAVGAFGSVAMGLQTHYVDRVAPYGVAPIRPVEVSFAEAAYSVRETGRANVVVELSKPATQTVSVTYGVGASLATPGRDYEAIGGTLSFEPGETTQSFSFNAIDDGLHEGQEQLMLLLTAVEGAEFGFQRRATMTIRDDDERDPRLLFDFERFPPLRAGGPVSLTLARLLPGDERALPGQTEPEQALEVQYTGGAEQASLDRRFGEGQDWREHAGLTFWFYGENSGAVYTVELLENRLSLTAEMPPEQWQLLWSDEFDGPAGLRPNPAIWQPEIGDGTLNGIPGWGNSELEYYTGAPENASTDGEGNLAITARAIDTETNDLICWYGPCAYTSARLITRDRLEVAYGRVEARLKLPAGQGIWPAFWMLGTNLETAGWPQSGEIDIMENIGREPATVHGTIHGPGYSGADGIGQGTDLPEGAAFADDFHVFAVEWRPDEIRWLVDGEAVFTVTPDDIPPGAEWVYNHPFFLILNVAVGGNWPGLPDETSTFPQTMLVDYVRVYGAESSGERYSATFVDDVAGWREVTLPFAAFAGDPETGGAAPQLTNVSGFRFVLPAGHSGTFLLDRLRFLD